MFGQAQIISAQDFPAKTNESYLFIESYVHLLKAIVQREAEGERRLRKSQRTLQAMRDLGSDLLVWGNGDTLKAFSRNIRSYKMVADVDGAQSSSQWTPSPAQRVDVCSESMPMACWLSKCCKCHLQGLVKSWCETHAPWPSKRSATARRVCLRESLLVYCSLICMSDSFEVCNGR